MKQLTSEWVALAEGDFASLAREMRARNAPNYHSACFHAQQCAEKYMKALLQEAGTPFLRTHNLVGLMNLILPSDPSWQSMQPDLQSLSIHAVAVRYPGFPASRAIALDARNVCRDVRKRARTSLGLSV